MAETETKETDTKAHEGAEPATFEAEEGKSPKQIAEDFVIPMSSGALKEWEGKEGFAEYAAEVASGLYPTLAPRIAMGMTTKTLLDPYVQIAKKLLGSDHEVDWQNPVYARALSAGFDPKTKSPTVMPLSDWEQYLRVTPGTGYEFTPAAHAATKDFLDHFASGTGKWDGSVENDHAAGATPPSAAAITPQGGPMMGGPMPGGEQ